VGGGNPVAAVSVSPCGACGEGRAAIGVGSMRRIILIGLLTLVSGTASVPGVGGRAAAAGFPDVPPWHWAHDGVQKGQDAGILLGYPATAPELVENAVAQVYDGFAHAGAGAAQAWVERFTYNRPANWPQPLQASRIVRFALREMRTAIHGNTATATFTAAVTARQGQDVSKMRVTLRREGEDWQVDYASLAAGSALFR
jgi:hypothetical protein